MSKHQTAKRQVQHYNGTGLTSQAIHFMKRGWKEKLKQKEAVDCEVVVLFDRTSVI